MLGSLITRPVRFATRLTWWGATTSLHIAADVLGLITGHHGSDGDGNGGGPAQRGGSEPAAWRGPAASSTSAPADAPPTRSAGAGETSAQRSATAPQVNGSAAAGTEGGAAAAQAESATAPSPAQEADRPGDRPIEEQGQEEVVDAELVTDAPELRPEAPVDYDAPASTEPAHVSEEPELVEEVAEPGAEDGAGAQIRIDEPWEGYRSMKAADIIARLAAATPEELATVQLFEMSGRNRKSVLAAAERALRQASPPR